MEASLFRLHDFLKEDEVFHLARVRIHSRQDLSLHTHDYAEIFWVESGKGYHLINGQKKRLEPGDLVMMRPDDIHTFTSSREGLTIMNLAFGTETLGFLKERYFESSTTFFWASGKLPYRIKLDIEIIHRISQRAEESMLYRNEKLDLDSLLLFIIRMIRSGEKMSRDMNMPEWLVKAIHKYNAPEYFETGVTGFAALCNKTIDHVNRVVKKYLDKTLSDLVKELRLNFASHQLIMTNVPIKTISRACGYTNLGHFYRTFKSVYHLTPSQFRRINQTVC